MIPQITEINFPSYATLHQATVSLQEMGDRVITTQIRIDGDIAPDFEGWELEFKGERFVLPTREPQAVKDNTTRNSIVDLTFYSWPVYQMKRFFFAEMTAINSSTAIADKYNASMYLNLPDFVDAFNDVLNYYFGGKIVMDLASYAPGAYSTDAVFVEIDYSYIWDVLTKIYELYNARWYIVYDSTEDVYTIKVGYLRTGIDDHEFEYGYQGGLLKFERQVQDDTIVNILLGRGGEKNLPYRYFKDTDSGNPDWTADPDAIPELANIYFDRLRDVNFRWYVRGWMQNSHRDHSWDATHTFPTYTISSDSPYYYAYNRGMTDERFNPVEFVKDDESILKYGEHWGALEDNDDIYPTIQGAEVDPYGRIDEAVDVSEILTDDMDVYASESSVEMTLADVSISLKGNYHTTHTLYSETFVIPSGQTGNVTYIPFSKETVYPEFVFVDTTNTVVEAEDGSGNTHPISGITAGTYRLKVTLAITFQSPAEIATGTFGISNIVITTSNGSAEGWKPTFDIWVKNIWGTTQGTGESDEDYSLRVWQKILGDRVGGEAKIAFSTGPMAASEDYEFTIASYPMPDNTKSIVTYVDGVLTTVPSHWRITLYKSDAEFDATGLYIPNSQSPQPVAGDHFYFLGIDMPFQYVELAEERLNAFKQNNVDGTAEVSPTWVISIDKVRCNTLEGEEYGDTLAERLATGATVRIKDPRFTNGQVLILYVQSIKYTWNEPSKGKPYLVPDIEVVLSDKVVATIGTVGKMQSQINQISSTYVRAEDVEAAIRQVAGALFLKKTGEEDKSASPTKFANKVTSANFRPGGVGGRGWGLYEDNADSYDVGTVMSPSSSVRRAPTRDATSESDQAQDNKAVFEIDKLIVRDELQVNSLVVNQISYQGGMEIISAAEIEVTMVIETADTYDCYFDQKQNSVENLFVVNDIAYGQVWEPDNTNLRYYKCLVTAIGLNYISLSKTVKDGQGIPQKGDVIVQYGHTTNTARQYVIVRDVIGGGYERMLCNLNSVSATGKEYYFAGRVNGETDRWFVGDKPNGEYAEWYDGELNIKGRVIVRRSDGTYIAMNQYIADNSYLTDALLNGATIVDGGLVLSSMIQLGKTEQVSGEDQFVVYSGMNGVMDASKQGGGIAAWYGGPMVDHEASQSATSYAKSLFRFDGSGYLASGNIGWDASGNGHIPGINWSGNDIIISGNVKLQSTTGDSVTDLINAVTELTSYFEKINVGTQANPVWVIHVKDNMGFYADTSVSAGGVGTGGGGSGSVSYLNDLTDVTAPSPRNGDLLVYSSGAWVNVAQSQIVPSIGFSDLTSHPTDLSGYGITDAYTKTEVDGLLANIDLSDYVTNEDLAGALETVNVLADITTPQDGTVVFTWTNGDVVNVDLNHQHSNYVPITRQINGHSLNADVTLSAVTDLGVAPWAMGTGSTIPFGRLPAMYIGKTRVKDTNTSNDTLIGISGFTTAASPTASGDTSLVEWVVNDGVGSWHFKGNLYVDGWFAAGGVGSGGGSSLVFMDNIQDVDIDETTLATGDVLRWNDSTQNWENQPLNVSIAPAGYQTLGGITVSSNPVSSTPTLQTISTTSDRYYAVQVDSDGLAFVNVPWSGGSGSSASWGTYSSTAHTIELTVNGTSYVLCENGYSAGGGVSSESDPVFTASPAYGITAADITAWRAIDDYALKTGDSSYNFLVNTLKFTYGKFTTNNSPLNPRPRWSYTDGTSLTPTTVTKDLAYKDEIPTSLKCPNKLNFKNGDTTTIQYDGSVTRNVTASDLGAVTITGTETISGAKTFTADITLTGADIMPSTNGTCDLGGSSARFANLYAVDANLSGDLAVGGDLSVASGQHIDLGPVRLEFANNALHVTTNDATNYPTIGLYADGFVSSGGVGSSSQYIRYVYCTLSEYNALATKDEATMYFIGDPVSRIYLGTITIYSEA